MRRRNTFSGHTCPSAEPFHPMSLTQKWLRQQVQPYPSAHRVYSDIDATLTRFPTLRPKSDVFSNSRFLSQYNHPHFLISLVFDDGRSQLLLCVHGLLPISFRGASYNIPMAFWVTRDYPRLPPISFVMPTNDMLVKSGKYLDVSGRCNIEYIQNWERKPEVRSSAIYVVIGSHDVG